MADPFIQYLMQGDLLGFIIACYTSPMGMGFYGYLLAMFSIIFYNRTRSIGFISIMWLVLGGVFISLTWMFSPLAVILVTLGIVGIIYSLFESEAP